MPFTTQTPQRATLEDGQEVLFTTVLRIVVGFVLWMLCRHLAQKNLLSNPSFKKSRITRLLVWCLLLSAFGPYTGKKGGMPEDSEDDSRSEGDESNAGGGYESDVPGDR